MNHSMVGLVIVLPAATWMTCAPVKPLTGEEQPALVYGDKTIVSITTGSRQALRRAPAVATVVTAEDMTANYEIRSLKVAYPGATGSSGTPQAQQVQLTNARNIVDSMGNRFSVQLTYIF